MVGSGPVLHDDLHGRPQARGQACTRLPVGSIMVLLMSSHVRGLGAPGTEDTMGHYKSNLREIEFTLFDVLERGEVLGRGRYADIDVETGRSILAEVDRLAREEIADSYQEADHNLPVYDPTARTVTLPDSFKRTFRALMDAEWYKFALPPELGGRPVPPSLYWAGAELILGANAAVWMYATGPSFAHVIWRNGTPAQKRIAEIMLERGWGA